MAEEKKDWVPVVAIGIGAVGVAAGIYFYTRKPSGVSPGETIRARFVFDYYGEGGKYILQVSLGKVLIMEPWFDHVEGLTWEEEVELPAPDHYQIDMECKLPAAVAEGGYDAEAGIRALGSHWLDFIEKVYAKGVVKVRE